MNKLLQKLSDITNIHKRANFADVPDRLPTRESEFYALAKERYSCREFKDTPLTDIQINHILEAARVAPSAANKQPVHVWVVKSPEALDKLRGATDYTFNAPVVFMVGASRDAAWVRKYDGKNLADVDAAIVGTHIMLAATDLGLGSTWVGWFDNVKLAELFPEMRGWDLVALFPIGYPDADPAPKHTLRKPMEELVERL